MTDGHQAGPVWRLVAMLVGAVVAVILLHRLGAAPWFAIDWRDLPAWCVRTPAEDLVVALLRQSALVCAYWLLVSTVLYAVARLVRGARLLRVVTWATLPAVRRLVDRTVAVTLLGSMLTGTGASTVVAQPLPAVGAVVAEPPRDPGPDLPALLPAAPRPEAALEVPRQAPATPSAPPTAMTPGPPLPARQYTVRPGDCLWDIARDALAEGWQRPPDATETASYWAVVIRTVAPALRSQDPDLIFPGEVLTLPVIPAGPQGTHE